MSDENKPVHAAEATPGSSELGVSAHGGWANDPVERKARRKLRELFEEECERIFFPRQLATIFEDEFFHWVTARAIRNLAAEGLIQSETASLPASGNQIQLLRHRRFRYYRRAAAEVLRLVDEYAHPNIGAAIGVKGEGLVLGAFADEQFVLKAREARAFLDRTWTRTQHDFDFVFERDGLACAIEVKNTLAYPDPGEVAVKIRIAQYLGLVPVFVARMMPKTMIHSLNKVGGFALILKYQLYPYSHKDLARRVADTFKMPVDAPRRISETTIGRFTRWHEKRVNSEVKSQRA